MLSRVYYHNQLCQTSAQYLASHLANLGLSQVTLIVRNLPANAGDIRDVGSVPGLGRSPREEHGNPLQFTCLENPMDRGAWWTAVHRVAESDTTEVA